MTRYKISYNDENCITKEEAATLNIGDVVIAAKRFPDTRFLPCEKDGSTIQINTPLSIRFWGLENRDIGYEMELFSVRKYDDGIPEVETLHTVFQQVLMEKGLGGQCAVNHDAPAFYRTILCGSLQVLPSGNIVEDIILPLEKKAYELFEEAYDRAIDMNIEQLWQLKQARLEKKTKDDAN